MTADGQVVMAADESKKKNNKAWNWIILDSSGEEVVVDVEKRAIMQRVQIHARDLRILDPNLTSPSAIFGRQRAIILNLEHIKAIITSEEVLVRDPTDDNVVPVVEELRRRLKNGRDREDDGDEEEDTFEFGALEVILEAICSYLSARALELSTAVYPALDMIMSKISGRNLDRIRKLKSRMTRLTSRVQKVRDELEKLLEDDDDMANLYLSRKLAVTAGDSKVSDTGRGDETDVEELEMILEAYFSEIDGTLNNLNTLRQYVDNTEDYIIMQLDSHRNQLIQLELYLTAGIVCLALYSLVATIFGMNIPYSWMDGHGYMFKWVVIFGGVLSAVLFIFIMCYARYKGLVN